jgi:hypothetical protein
MSAVGCKVQSGAGIDNRSVGGRQCKDEDEPWDDVATRPLDLLTHLEGAGHECRSPFQGGLILENSLIN